MWLSSRRYSSPCHPTAPLSVKRAWSARYIRHHLVGTGRYTSSSASRSITTVVQRCHTTWSAIVPRSAAAVPAGQQQVAAGNCLALKEWAVACAALAAGDQTLLFRKGGIKEGVFKPKAAACLLFPTGFHSHANLLKPEFSVKYAEELRFDPKEHNPLLFSVAAQITGAWTCAQGADVLDVLDKFHVWSQDFLEVRLKWRVKQPLTILEVRALNLQEPIHVEAAPDLFGCFSWVDLEGQVPKAEWEGALWAAKPAIPDQEFAQRQAALRQVLNKAVVVEPLPMPNLDRT